MSRLFWVLFFVWPNADCYASINLSLPDESLFSSGILQLIALITLLGLAPSLLITVTSFTRIVVVLSFLRNSIGLQQTPPNVVITSLALFLTMFIMMPTLTAAYDDGILPMLHKEIDEKMAFTRIAKPFHEFMMMETREKDLEMLLRIAEIGKINKAEDTPFRILVPAFMLSELHRAFEIGFLLFLPFLIIDLLVASILMSLGMMMLPPASISLPFKLIFFVLIDGWNLVAESLTRGF